MFRHAAKSHVTCELRDGFLLPMVSDDDFAPHGLSYYYHATRRAPPPRYTATDFCATLLQSGHFANAFPLRYMHEKTLPLLTRHDEWVYRHYRNYRRRWAYEARV